MAAYGFRVESFDHVIINLSHIWTYRPDTKEITTFIDTVGQMVRYDTVEIPEENCWYASALADGLFFTGKAHCKRCAENDCAKAIYLYWKRQDQIPDTEPIPVMDNFCLASEEYFIEHLFDSGMLDDDIWKLKQRDRFVFES